MPQQPRHYLRTYRGDFQEIIIGGACILRRGRHTGNGKGLRDGFADRMKQPLHTARLLVIHLLSPVAAVFRRTSIRSVFVHVFAMRLLKPFLALSLLFLLLLDFFSPLVAAV